MSKRFLINRLRYQVPYTLHRWSKYPNNNINRFNYSRINSWNLNQKGLSWNLNAMNYQKAKYFIMNKIILWDMKSKDYTVSYLLHRWKINRLSNKIWDWRRLWMILYLNIDNHSWKRSGCLLKGIVLSSREILDFVSILSLKRVFNYFLIFSILNIHSLN